MMTKRLFRTFRRGSLGLLQWEMPTNQNQTDKEATMLTKAPGEARFDDELKADPRSSPIRIFPQGDNAVGTSR